MKTYLVKWSLGWDWGSKGVRRATENDDWHWDIHQVASGSWGYLET
jgi:hypothetical protein